LTIRTRPRPQSLLEEVARARAERRRDTPDRVELGVGGFVLDLGDEPLVQAGVGRERLLAQPARKPQPAGLPDMPRRRLPAPGTQPKTPSFPGSPFSDRSR